MWRNNTELCIVTAVFASRIINMGVLTKIYQKMHLTDSHNFGTVCVKSALKVVLEYGAISGYFGCVFT